MARSGFGVLAHQRKLLADFRRPHECFDDLFVDRFVWDRSDRRTLHDERRRGRLAGRRIDLKRLS